MRSREEGEEVGDFRGGRCSVRSREEGEVEDMDLGMVVKTVVIGGGREVQREAEVPSYLEEVEVRRRRRSSTSEEREKEEYMEKERQLAKQRLKEKELMKEERRLEELERESVKELAR